MESAVEQNETLECLRTWKLLYTDTSDVTTGVKVKAIHTITLTADNPTPTQHTDTVTSVTVQT